MDKILSVSVAAYNVEKFISQTLESCCNIPKALIDKLEILVVDDGSIDSTGEIAMKFQEMYPMSVFYVKKENGGHGSTINYSMKHSTGKYFMLLDGDDYVDTENFQKLICKLEYEDADLVSCNYFMVNNNTQEKQQIVLNKDFKVDQLYQSREILSNVKLSLASFIIKTEVLKKYPFKITENCFYVDMEYITFPIAYINSIKFYDFAIYNCRVALQTQSTSRVGSVKHAKDHVIVAKSLLDFYIKLVNSCPTTEIKNYVFNVCKKVVEDVYLLPFAFPITDKNIRLEIVKFDNYVKNECKELYYSKYRKSVTIMRNVNYHGWQLFSLLDKLRERVS